MSTTKLTSPLVISVLVIAGAGCDDRVATPIPASPPSEPVPEATAPADDRSVARHETGRTPWNAEFKSAPHVGVRGEAELEEVAGGVLVEVRLEGAPAGEKGLHIHQTADCSDIPNKSMGGHFAPENRDHGLPTAEEHHTGDLGNITANEAGAVDASFKDQYIALRDGKNMFNVAGRSIVVRQGADDFTTQSDDGGAGKILAYGTLKQSS